MNLSSSEFANPPEPGGPHLEDRVADVAVRSLKLRLEAVNECLPRAAREWKRHPEYVHQLRVRTRRALAALALYRELLPRRRRRRLEKQLRTIRAAAGEARDLDVLILKGLEQSRRRKVARWLQASRRAAQRPILALNRKLATGGRFARQVAKFLERIPRKRRAAIAGLPFGPWARAAVARVIGRFFEMTTPCPTDLSALHRLRIRGKALRYTLELTGPAFPDELTAAWSQTLEEIQEQLGTINDHDVARQHFKELLRQADSPRLALRARALIRQEEEGLAAAQQRFATWWSTERQLQLRSDLDRALCSG